MTESIARVVILAGVAIGAVAWLAAVLRSIRIARQARERSAGTVERVQVQGDPEAVSKAIVSALTGGTGPAFVPMRIEHADAKRVSFRTGTGLAVLPLTSALRGEFLIGPAEDGKVRVSLVTNGAAAMRGAHVAMLLSTLLGLPLLVGIGLTLWFLVPGSPHLGGRMQAIQIIHVGHALWPPFLLQWLGVRSQRMVEESLGRVLDRLRFCPAAPDPGLGSRG